MTNIIASLIILTSTNWISVETLKGSKEVGIIIQDTYAQVVWDNETNRYIQESLILGQVNIRDKIDRTIWYTNRSFYIPQILGTNYPYIVFTNNNNLR